MTTHLYEANMRLPMLPLELRRRTNRFTPTTGGSINPVGAAREDKNDDFPEQDFDLLANTTQRLDAVVICDSPCCH